MNSINRLGKSLTSLKKAFLPTWVSKPRWLSVVGSQSKITKARWPIQMARLTPRNWFISLTTDFQKFSSKLLQLYRSLRVSTAMESSQVQRRIPTSKRVEMQKKRNLAPSRAALVPSSALVRKNS